jgi:hypothetical protein
MALTLFGSVPLSYYLLIKRQELVHYLHPGQENLKKITYFEAITFLTCFVMYVISGTDVAGYSI